MMNQIEQDAKNFAILLHQNHRYESGPYTDHLQAVVDILKEVTSDPAILAAGWLHDAIEDTEVSKEEIAYLCGDVVADLVWKVTDEPGHNRKERKAKTYPKIASDPRAVMIKLADRCSHLENVIHGGNIRFASMYLKEHEDFLNLLMLCEFDATLYTTDVTEGFAALWSFYRNLIPMIEGYLALSRESA